MADNLRLQVILNMVDKATNVLKKIQGGSKDAAQSLKATRDKLSELNKAQSNINGYRLATVEVRKQQRALQELRDKVKAHTASLDQQRAAHANIKASLNTAKQAHDKLTQAYMDGKDQSAAATRQIELARITLLKNQQAYEKSLASIKKYQAQVKNTSEQVAQTTQRHSAATARLQGYKTQLDAAGIGTTGLGNKSRALRAEMNATTTSIDNQKKKLKELAEQQKKIDALKSSHAKSMMRTGILAAGGVGAMAAGRGMARPVGAAMGAYGQQEDATSQLRGSMMQANGSVSAEFKAINELAQRLGDRLPGTTADFTEMMTMLQRQGLSAKSVLGGTGEAAAYLGVQLRMPVTAAAEFAAKMQDATRTTEGDMMGLMDMIQRTFYLGVDSGNMLQGFTKMAPALGIIHQEGLKAANTLAPLLVMMDQAGMAGEASGNAIRKIFQAGLDEKKLGKANKLLAGEGFQMKFVNGKGQFAGIDNLFAQLKKLKGITNDVKRTAIIKELFGDDAENMQVLNTMMDKGLDGYNEVTAKMQAQADLRQRVTQQLQTLTNVKGAAEGAFTNVLASLGETVAPEAKALIDWLGEIAGKTRAWIAENPVLVGWLVKAVAIVAALTFILGTLAVTLASVIGPFLMMRFAIGWLGLQGPAFALVLRGIGSAIGFVGTMLSVVGRAMLMTPIGWIIAGIAVGALLIYKYWQPIKAFFAGVWAGFSDALAPAFAAIGKALEPLRPVFNWLLGILGSIWNWFTALLAPMQATQQQLQGISNMGQFLGQVLGKLVMGFLSIPSAFFDLGTNVIMGFVNGLTAGLGFLQNKVVGMAQSVRKWFSGDLAIKSPSRVFMGYGGFISEGTALGISRGYGRVRQAAAGLSLAATSALPLASLADTGALRMDTRPPLSSSPARAAAVAGDTITINITAAPGMDPQAIARAVSAELDRRQRAKRAGRQSALTDID